MNVGNLAIGLEVVDRAHGVEASIKLPPGS
jgi:hypothetical protein